MVSCRPRTLTRAVAAGVGDLPGRRLAPRVPDREEPPLLLRAAMAERVSAASAVHRPASGRLSARVSRDGN